MSITPAGIQADESATEAASLNQTHIGLAFGANLDSGDVVYGRIAAFRIGSDVVTVHLSGVDDAGEEFSTLHFDHQDKLYFSRYTREAHIEGMLERIEQAVQHQNR